MRVLNNKGFTLLEMAIVIAVLSIAIGMTTFGIGVIFHSNADSYSEQFASDLKGMRNDALYYSDRVYTFSWHYDTTEKEYSYKIEYVKSGTTVVVKTVNVHKDIQITKDETLYDSTDNGNDLYEILNESNQKGVIKFITRSGGIEKDGSDNSGAGIYKFISKSSSDTFTVSVYPERGRVFLDE